MAIALLGIVVAGVGCTSTTPQARVADEVAAQLGPRVASDLAAAEGADLIQVMWRAVDRLDSPEGVERLAAGGSGKTHDTEDGRDGASVSVVVEPDNGGPYCIIVGVDPGGANEGVPATGNASEGCVHAAPIGPTGHRLHGWPVARE